VVKLGEISIRILKSAVLAYAGFVAIWFFSNRLFQDSWWGLVVLDKFAEYLILPAIPVFIFSVFTRRKQTIVASFLPVLVCAFFYAPFLKPISSEADAENENHFRVATFNIWNHNKNIKAVVDVINATQADVIALQEITEEQRSQLVAGLVPTYPYYHISKPVYGGTTAIFSRFQLNNVVELDIQIDRPSIIADLIWNESVITVVSAHLNPSFWAYWRQPWFEIPGNYLKYIKDQNRQVKEIQNELEQRSKSKATFLACDCNSQETASTNRLLRKTFNETYRSLGWQLGKSVLPGFRFEHNLTHIDYIWFSGDMLPVAIYRGMQNSQSDHDPIMAVFE